MNISQHTSNFIEEMKRRNYSKNTIDNYAYCISKFFSESTKDHPSKINEKDIKEFLGKFTEVNTQRNYHSAIKKFYLICMKQKDKFKYIPYAQKNNKLPIVLSVDEIQRMFDVCENTKHKVCIIKIILLSLHRLFSMKILKEIPHHSLPNSNFRYNWISLCLVVGIFYYGNI